MPNKKENRNKEYDNMKLPPKMQHETIFFLSRLMYHSVNSRREKSDGKLGKYFPNFGFSKMKKKRGHGSICFVCVRDCSEERHDVENS